MERLQKIGELPRLGASEISSSKIGIGFEKLDRNVFDPNRAYDKVAAIGVKYIRLQSGWMRTEKEKGVYDFAWLDEIVDNLIARGMTPWLCLCYGNPLYTDFATKVFGAVGCPPISTDEEREAWSRYVRATVTHFKGRISLYEIWNEPDCPYSWKHWFGQKKDEMDFVQNAHEYGQFAKETAIAIRETDGDAGILGFALAHLHKLDFVQQALSTGLADYIDYVSFHSYSVSYGKRVERIEALRRLLHTYNPAIELIQGESGAQSRSDGHGAAAGFAWTPERQVKAQLRLLLCDLYAGVAFTSYFSTMDMVEALKGLVGDRASYMDYGYFGVLSAEFDEEGRATGTYGLKPSYHSLSTLANLMKGDCRADVIPYTRQVLPSLRVNGNDCDDPTLCELCFALDDGTHALFYWNETDLLTTSYEGTVSFSFFGKRAEDVRLLDPRNGSIYRLPDSMVEEGADGTLLLKNIPVTDCPLAILIP